MVVYRQPSLRFAPKRLAAAILLLVLAVIAVQWHPGLVPQRDSGVVLYIGQRILAGEVPYLDVWDHKGPLLYFINALGLLMTSGSSWGVWIIQFGALAWATLALHQILIKNGGVVAATLGMLLTWPLFLVTISGGNLSEVYTVPLQVWAILITLNTFTKGDSKTALRFILLGAILALAALLRPNNIGVPVVACFLAIFGSTPDTRVRRLLDMFIGFAIPFGICVGYLNAKGALQPFFDQYIMYNFIYAGSGAGALASQSTLEAARFAIKPLTVPGLWFLLALGAFSMLNPPPSPTNNRQRLAVLGMLSLVVEFGLSLLGGASRPDYFLLLLVPMSILGAAGIAFVIHLIALMLPRSMRLRGALVFAGVIALLINPLRDRIVPAVMSIGNLDLSTAPLVGTELTSVTQRYEHLQVWGAEARLNFLANTPAPSKFVYLYPLMQCGYLPPEMPMMIEQFTKNIIESKPIIIDAATTNPRIVPLISSQRREWFLRYDECNLEQKFEPLLAFLDAEYREVQILTGTLWRVLTPKNRMPGIKSKPRAGQTRDSPV